MLFIGIDPGKQGAIAVLDGAGTVLSIRKFADAQTEGRIALVIMDAIAEYPEDEIKAATIEKVGAMPRQGVASMFTFGRVYGEAWAGLVVTQCRVVGVTPVQWQRELRLPRREDTPNHKKTLKQMAEARWGRSFTLAECDAVWIAEWGRLFGPWAVRPSPLLP